MLKMYSNGLPAMLTMFVSLMLFSGYNCWDYTAGMSPCRKNSCGRHRYDYSWCYTARSWDYCCEGDCTKKYGGDLKWCDVGGGRWQLCGSSGMKTHNGENCRYDFPCGVHSDYPLFSTRHWCYTSITGSWDYCWAPDIPNNSCVMRQWFWNNEV